MDHHTTIHEVGEGSVQAVCSYGWRTPVFGADKAAGTMDPLHRAADADDLHEREMSPQDCWDATFCPAIGGRGASGDAERQVLWVPVPALCRLVRRRGSSR